MQGQTNPLPEVEALFFDVFGTVVDWRRGVAREAENILKPLGYTLDWLAFADAWRGEYQSGMEVVRAGHESFVKLDVIHRRMLDKIRPRFGLEKLDEATQAQLNLAWHRLDAWPDVGPGFARLRTRYALCPCSNGNIAIMADIGRRNDLRWHAILGSEIAGDFKPKPRVYLASAEALNLKPSQCMMVAAHSPDLKAAAAQGLRTGHVGRPGEGGPGTGETEPHGTFDVVARDFPAFAAKMGT
ncbi:MAG: HAD-IA family hydrolase [Bradyrhizobiaceae bacterium]|nr:HAD-IA family hydrolase [Bradyrhizobiaceae bacterium]